MIIYTVYNGDEYDQAFASKKEAFAAARFVSKAEGDVGACEVRVTKCSTRMPARSLALAIYNELGWAEQQEEIARFYDGRRRTTKT